MPARWGLLYGGAQCRCGRRDPLSIHPVPIVEWAMPNPIRSCCATHSLPVVIGGARRREDDAMLQAASGGAGVGAALLEQLVDAIVGVAGAAAQRVSDRHQMIEGA